MADLKFGNVTPAVGNIKLGSNNVSEIYQGATKLWPQSSPPSPGEVTVCDLVWTRENSIITATTTGGNIPIVTNSTDWVNAISNQQAAACYWDFDSNNAFRGLYYNIFTTEVIQPPTGFRIPTVQDFNDLRNCVNVGSPDGVYDVTSLGNNYYGFYTSNLPSNPRFGTVDFNSIGSGYVVKYNNLAMNFTGQGKRDVYWAQQTAPISSLTRFWCFLTYDYGLSQNPGYLEGFTGEAVSSSTTSRHGFYMRFVKDVVTNTGIYGNFTGSPDETQSGTPSVYTQTAQTSFSTSNNQQNRVATSIITNSTYDEFRFKAKINNGSFTMNSIQIFAYSDSARTNLVYQTNPWTGPVAMTSSYQDPWGSLTLSTPGTYFLKVSFNLTSSGQQGYQLTLT